MLAVLAGTGSFGLVRAADPAAQQAPTAVQTPPTRSSSGGRQTSQPVNQPSSALRRLLGRGFEWWKDDEVKREIKLTDEKANRIESMYAKLEKDRTPLLKELEHEWARLDRMTKERTADETAYMVQVRKFESLAASWREMRTVLMYQMYKELKPEQYSKLQEIVERRFGGPSDGRGRGPGSAPNQGSGR